MWTLTSARLIEARQCISVLCCTVFPIPECSLGPSEAEMAPRHGVLAALAGATCSQDGLTCRRQLRLKVLYIAAAVARNERGWQSCGVCCLHSGHFCSEVFHAGLRAGVEGCLPARPGRTWRQQAGSRALCHQYAAPGEQRVPLGGPRVPPGSPETPSQTTGPFILLICQRLRAVPESLQPHCAALIGAVREGDIEENLRNSIIK